MDNVTKFQELRDTAKKFGFTNDRFYFIPIRERADGRKYFPYDGEYSLLFNPSWVQCLVGNEMIDTGLFGQDLEPVQYPAYKHYMIEMTKIRAEKGDAVSYLYEVVIKRLSEKL
jgi:hypothetical protein